MKNQSVSDFVAASMNAVLNSKEHKSLFDVQYKYAQDMNDAKKGKCGECDKSKEDCKCDSSKADDDDNDARKRAKEDDSAAWDNDDNDARKRSKDEDEACAEDGDTDKDTEKSDWNDASDGLETSVAYDVAIDSLLTASAALDSVGLGRGSAFSLKLASLVVEAKKKDKDSKKDKKKDSQSAKDKKSDKKSDSKKKDDKKKDSQSAKDKKSDSKKSDSKKSDSKDSKKPFPFAKKK